MTIFIQTPDSMIHPFDLDRLKTSPMEEQLTKEFGKQYKFNLPEAIEIGDTYKASYTDKFEAVLEIAKGTWKLYKGPYGGFGEYDTDHDYDDMQLDGFLGLTTSDDIINGINARDNDDRTLLMIAMSCHELDIAKLLIIAGADINLVDNENRDAITHAVSKDYVEGFDLLVDVKVDINCFRSPYEHFNETLLMTAARCDSVEVAKRLIDLGVDVNVRNSDDQDAWDISMENYLDSEMHDLLGALGEDDE